MRGINLTILVLGVIALAAWGATAVADRERPVSPADIERASKAAVAAVGSGTATSVDRDREGGSTWEVEVVKPDGGHVDVLLDGAFKVLDVGPERDAAEPPRAQAPAGTSDDETPVPTADAERASAAALKAVGSGTVLDVDRDIEGGATWEVEIVKADGTRVDVLLDAEFRVLSVGGEQEPGEVSDGD